MIIIPRPRASESGRLSPAVSIILAASLMIFLGVEIFARSNSTYTELMHPKNLMQHLEVNGDFLIDFDEHSGRRLYPDARVVLRHHYLTGLDVPIMVNALGFRDDEIPLGKRDNELRVLLLGDSFVFADHIPVKESLSEQLQKALADTYQDRIVEVVNAGVSDIGLTEYVNILKDRGIEHSPDYVLVAFSLDDSLRPWSVGLGLTSGGFLGRYSVAASAFFRYLAIRRWLEGDYGKRFRWVSSQYSLDWAHSKEAFDQLVNLAEYDWGAAWKDDSWDSVIKNFIELKQLSKKHGFKIAVMAVPVPYQVGAEFVDDVPQKKLAALCSEMGFAFFDLLPVLRPFRAEELFYDHNRLTPFGYKTIGEPLAKFLSEEVIREAPKIVESRKTLSAWKTDESDVK
ncbi:MAG: hypothetical protein KDD66_07740 [Bdellovibrionales bacterium]|nr:hypothetical protein [Bdellovibrionales bacterium]